MSFIQLSDPKTSAGVTDLARMVMLANPGTLELIRSYTGEFVEFFEGRVRDTSLFEWPDGITSQDIYVFLHTGYAKRRVRFNANEGPVEFFILCEPKSLDYLPAGVGGCFLDYAGTVASVIGINREKLSDVFNPGNLRFDPDRKMFNCRIYDAGEHVRKLMDTFVNSSAMPQQEIALAACLFQLHGDWDRKNDHYDLPRLQRVYRDVNQAFDQYKDRLEHGSNAGDRLPEKLKSFESEVMALWGKTPHQYLLERRLLLAERLLTSTEMALVEIALECGFSSQAHFNSCFKSRYGITPGQYRRDLSMNEPKVAIRVIEDTHPAAQKLKRFSIEIAEHKTPSAS